ncbi:hypothetical protein [Nocardioides cynanchi]|uniref:hypothetical protein n=1 Tax=Nocardioides cynanchi TaxID=2558918 RepID=UPI001243AAA9|nr:hypothetical protein [Nocardioides cynanchi]
MRLAERFRGLWRTERPFLVAVALGVVVRVVIAIAFPPAFVMSDAPAYLDLVDHLVPPVSRPAGYGAVLRVLSWVSRSLWVISTTQVLMGLATAVLAYVLLRRWGVSTLVATLATLPLLFDSMQLLLEHAVLSDVLFDLLLVAAVAALAWWPAPRLWTTAAAGLLLGLATLVRIVGEPSILAAVLFVLMAATTWRHRIAQAVVVCVAFALPLVAYAGWYHQENGVYALTQASGRALYMRTTTFVQCSKLHLPAYERVLCPREPLGSRREPTFYGWHSPSTLPRLHPPPGVTVDQALRDFAIRAIKSDPLAYLRVGARDFVLQFWAPDRGPYYEYKTSVKWTFAYFVDYRPSPSWTGRAFAEHGGQVQLTRQPAADVLSWYGRLVYVPGPATLVLLVVAVAGAVVRREEAPSRRPLTVLLVVLPLGLSLVPDLTAEFVWRYELPMFTMLPLAAALGWTRLRRAPLARPGTTVPALRRARGHGTG